MPPPRVPQQHHVVATEVRVRASAHAVGRVRRQGQTFSTVVRAVPQPQVLAVHAVLDRTAASRRRGRGARHVVGEPFAAVFVASNVVVVVVRRRVR